MKIRSYRGLHVAESFRSNRRYFGSHGVPSLIIATARCLFIDYVLAVAGFWRGANFGGFLRGAASGCEVVLVDLTSSFFGLFFTAVCSDFWGSVAFCGCCGFVG